MKSPALRFILSVSCATLLAMHLQGAEPSAGQLIVANKGDRSISIVDTTTNQQVATVAEEGVTGHELVASLDGKRVFVPIYGDAGVGKPGTDGQILRVIDLAERKIVGTLDFGKPVRPHCAVMNRQDGMLYVTTELENSVTVIDPATLQIKGSIPTSQAESHMLAISHGGTRGYTANVGPGTVSVLDLEKRKLLKVIPISKHTQRISISPNDHSVFTADQYTPQIVVIDTVTNEISKKIELPDIGYGTAVTPDGKWLIVALINLNEVGFVDLEEGKLVRTVKVPRAPQEVLIRPDGAVAYVSCDASKQVAVIDLNEAKVLSLIDTGTGTDGLAWAVAK